MFWRRRWRRLRRGGRSRRRGARRGAESFGGLVGEGDRVAGDFAQDGVDEAGGGAFAGAFDEFDGGGDGGVGGDAVEVAELENAEAEGDADLGIEFDGEASEVVD